MHERPIIGIIGLAGSGKIIVANHLADKFGYRRIRFGDPLKRVMRSMGLTEYEVDGEGKKKPNDLFGGMTPATVIKSLSSDWGRRMVHTDLWVNLWKRDVESSTVPVVADDIRNPNEAMMIQRMGGEIWRVFRPGLDSHYSEKAVKDVSESHLITNAGTIPDLIASVDALMDGRVDA